MGYIPWLFLHTSLYFQLDDEDGELRRMSLRKRSMSMSSRRSIVSAMSSARPLMGGSTSSTRSPSLSSQHSPPSPTHRVSVKPFHTIHHPPSARTHIRTLLGPPQNAEGQPAELQPQSQQSNSLPALVSE